ncbi:MAG: hypothetical protein ACW964_15785 [Candidatus Hodarchaeales archaeon]|jgi:hypothetical protein
MIKKIGLLSIPLVLWALGKKGTPKPPGNPIYNYGNYAKVMSFQEIVSKEFLTPIPLFKMEDFLALIATETMGNYELIGGVGERGAMQVSTPAYNDMLSSGVINFSFESMSTIKDNGVIAGMRHLYYIVYPNMGNSLEANIKAYNCGVTCVTNNGLNGVPLTTKEHWERFLRHKGAIKNLTGIVTQ